MLALKGQLLTVENGDITRRPATAEELLSIPLSDPYLFLRPSFFWSDELRNLYCKLRGCGSLKSNVKGREHFREQFALSFNYGVFYEAYGVWRVQPEHFRERKAPLSDESIYGRPLEPVDLYHPVRTITINSNN
jgi:hypothetical protein